MSIPVNSHHTQATIAHEYPGRIVYNTEAITDELAPLLGDCLLRYGNNLVMPYLRPNTVYEPASGDSLAQRAIKVLAKQGEPVTVVAGLGSAYSVIEDGGEASHLFASIHCADPAVKALRNEREAVNRCAQRWGLRTIGLQPVILVTRQRVNVEIARQIITILEHYQGTAIELSEPVVIPQA